MNWMYQGTLIVFAAYEILMLKTYYQFSQKKAQEGDVPFFRDNSQFNSTIHHYELPNCNLNNMNKLGPDTKSDCLIEKINIFPSVTGYVFSYLGWLDTSCYNCLGWSISEKKWLHTPREIFKNEKRAKEEVDAFFKLHIQSNNNQKLFSVTEIVKTFDKLSTDIQNENIKDGTVALYFQKIPNSTKLKWLHAAKYNEKIMHNDNEVYLKQWSSKLGMDFLTTHKDASTVQCVYTATNLIFYAHPLEYMNKDISIDADIIDNKEL